MAEEHLIREFIAEAVEHLFALEPNLLRLEKDPQNRDLVQEIFIATHGIKGTAAYVGLTHISNFTHALETLLDQLRKETLRATPELIDALLQGMDALKLLIQHVSMGKPAPDTSDIEARLTNWQPAAANATPSPASQPISAVTLYGVAVDPEDAEIFADIAGQQVEFMAFSFDRLRDALTQNPAQASATVAALTKAVSTIQSSAELLKIDHLSATIAAHLKFLASLEAPTHFIDEHDVDEIARMIAVFRDITARLTASAQTHPETAAAAPDEKKAAASIPLPPPLPPVEAGIGQHTLRVNAERVDELLNLVGELVINRARTMQVGQEIKAMYEDLRTGGSPLANAPTAEQKSYLRRLKRLKEQFDGVTLDLGRLTSQMQESTMRIRMVPVAQVVNRFPRMVRDLSRYAGKDVDMRIFGAETELDKTVVDVLGEPLIHLIRNAIDHGIESPEEREQAGKPRQGIITMSACHEGNQVIIEIQDDGRGIDAERVKKKAVQLALISPQDADALEYREAIALIFQSGFSTVETVSTLSGRGVGLHLVKRYLEKINGSVDVDSAPGKGCVFTIKLPLTLAIIPALMVSVGGDIFAIPLTAVEEAVRIVPQEIKTIESHRVVRLRERMVPLFELAELFGADFFANAPAESRDTPFLYGVVVSDGFREIGVIVDSVVGESDIVIKPLESDQVHVEGISGASIRGDGQVSLVIDSVSLIHLAIKHIQQAHRSRQKL